MFKAQILSEITKQSTARLYRYNQNKELKNGEYTDDALYFPVSVQTSCFRSRQIHLHLMDDRIVSVTNHVQLRVARVTF